MTIISNVILSTAAECVTSAVEFIVVWLVCVFLLVTGTAKAVEAQHQSEGMWFESGVGGGWNLYPGLEDGSSPNVGGYLRIGGAPTSYLLAGAEMLGWARSSRLPPEPGNYVFSAINLSAVILIYPFRSWPAYAKAGIGASSVDLSVDPHVGFQVRTRHSGIGATLGVGVSAPAVGPFQTTISADWGGQLFGKQIGKLRRIDHNAFVVLAIGIRLR